MKDLVFSCPACGKPLVVEEEAAGTDITCPLCDKEIRVPVVKTATLAKQAFSARPPASETLLHSRITNDLHDLLEAGNSLSRKVRDQEQQLSLIGDAVAVARERLLVFEKHLEPMHFKGSPSESVQIPGSWTPVPRQTLWKPLTLGFGILAFSLALILAFTAA